MNYRLKLQYDGTDFHGWQMQAKLRTVQAELTRVLSLIEGGEVVVHGAGRTDAGVHAEGQVAHVHLHRATAIAPDKLRAAINTQTKKDLRVVAVDVADDDFHARYDAQGKTYCYRIYCAPFISPFWVRYALHEARFLDAEKMRCAARLFVGTHDWTAFSSVHTEARTRVRTVTRLDITRRAIEQDAGQLLELTISADGFLRYMVRSIAGTLLAVGRGEITIAAVADAIRSGDRKLAGATAAAHGLTLLRVHY